MVQHTFNTLVLLIFLLIGSVHAQLGPRDNAGLKPTDLNRVKVGDRAPEFTLENIDGRAISLADYRGKKNVVLVFYRGHW
jgi:cytochrome oxidase Cu insertion factor (SCO1/SenC/PrrC family)